MTYEIGCVNEPLEPIEGSTENVNKIKFRRKKNWRKQQCCQSCYVYKIEVAFSIGKKWQAMGNCVDKYFETGIRILYMEI